VRVVQMVGFGIHIHYLDIDNGICHVGPKAMNEQVSTLFIT
jgi:hypothetical protein